MSDLRIKNTSESDRPCSYELKQLQLKPRAQRPKITIKKTR